jgi:hypothetical protein
MVVDPVIKTGGPVFFKKSTGQALHAGTKAVRGVFPFGVSRLFLPSL